MRIKTNKRIYKFALSLFIIIIIAIVTIKIFNICRVNEVKKMNSIKAIHDYISNKDNVVLTVGVINDGKTNYIVYGKDGTILPQYEYTYEIGSITKTFTTSLLSKALYDNKISLDDSVAKYIKLNDGQYYPTIKQLATHTAGYGAYPFSIIFKDIKNSFIGHQNPYSGFYDQSLIYNIQRKKLSDKEYKWQYSNFGMAVLGNVLGEVNKSKLQTLIENFIKEEFALSNTYVRTSNGNLNGYTTRNKVSNWEWKTDDAFLPAGSLVSNINDMLKYAEIQISGDKKYLSITHKKYAKTTIPGYDIGLGWILDTENKIIWHNGGTGGFNCFIGFDKEKKLAVVVMANYANQTDNNSTIIGFKILKELQEGKNLLFDN